MKKVNSTFTTPPSKLTLRKERIRVLSRTELPGVVGGEPTPSNKTTHQPGPTG